jgi:hypothetical protein
MNARQTLRLASLVLATACPVEAAQSHLETPNDTSAPTGETVTLQGSGFGFQPGHVVLTGLRITPQSWSDTRIRFVVPEDAASGFLRVRPAQGPPSESILFTVERSLPPGQVAPYGLQLEDTGLPGAALLVETDGAFLYGITGFETLSTYELQDHQPHRFRSRAWLNQRVADLRIREGFLFCVGDHGLLVFRCSDLQEGVTMPTAAIAGGSFIGVDVRPDPTGEEDGLLLALSEHAPRWGSDQLRVVFYRFAEEQLTPLGSYNRAAAAEERQFAVALDPLQRKAYVSGWISLSGEDKYLMELSTTNLAKPTLQHREETGHVLAGDMEAIGNRLWTGVTTTKLGNELFRTYRLHAGTKHLNLDQIITGRAAWGRVARVKVIDHRVTLGSAWFGNRPDIFLLSSFGQDTTAVASLDSLDWAFDVTGLAQPGGSNEGKVIVADEWGGFMTLDYQISPQPGLSHRPDYQWVPAAAMTEGLHLDGDRVYIAGRGAGPWSADHNNLTDESQWRRVDFDWTRAEPQPHPVSAVCTREDPTGGRLIAALGHEKAMAWGNQIIGLLYRETATKIELLAESEAFDPPGLYSQGVSVVWPEPDLVYMTTGTDGVRAYVVDPTIPSITVHQDCREGGFATNLYSTALTAYCLKHWTTGGARKLIVGSKPGLLVGDPALNLFSLSYPQGVPNREQPHAPIRVVHEAALQCMKWKQVESLDVRPSGWVAAATSTGLALFHLSWVPALNAMNGATAWARIHVPPEAYAPWWDSNWGAAVAEVSFGSDNTVYVVKAPEGLWRLAIEWDPANRTQRCMATGYYPGVQCGMDYRIQLHGWANPNIPTLHHPYGVVADGDTAFVTGWSGKVQRLTPAPASGVQVQGMRMRDGLMRLGFTSPFANRTHEVETTTDIGVGNWVNQPAATIHQTADRHYLSTCPTRPDPAGFFRIRVRP